MTKYFTISDNFITDELLANIRASDEAVKGCPEACSATEDEITVITAMSNLIDLGFQPTGLVNKINNLLA